MCKKRIQIISLALGLLASCAGVLETSILASNTVDKPYELLAVKDWLKNPDISSSPLRTVINKERLTALLKNPTEISPSTLCTVIKEHVDKITEKPQTLFGAQQLSQEQQNDFNQLKQTHINKLRSNNIALLRWICMCVPLKIISFGGAVGLYVGAGLAALSACFGVLGFFSKACKPIAKLCLKGAGIGLATEIVSLATVVIGWEIAQKKETQYKGELLKMQIPVAKKK